MVLNQEKLKSILRYNPTTGNFIWLINPKKHALINKKAGCVSCQKYILIGIAGRVYRAHRLAFLYMKGRVPKLVDHIDRNPANNKWNNLRGVSKSQNAINSKVRVDNSSGFKEVSLDKSKGRIKVWKSYIYRNGKQIYLGRYTTKKAAHAANVKKLKEIGMRQTNKCGC